MVYWNRFRICAIDRDKLFPIAEVCSKPVTGRPSYSIMTKFVYQNGVVNSVKSFLQIDKDTTGNFFAVQCRSYVFGYFDKGVIYGVFFAKSKLKVIYTVKPF